MKKLYYLLLASTVAVLLTSCGNNGNSGKAGNDDGLRPKQEAISGPLRDYFKVVDRAYTIRPVQGSRIHDYQIIIEIERIKKGLPEPWNESLGTKVGREPGQVDLDFAIEFYDKNGDICFKNESWYVDNYVKELQSLVDLAVGETGSLSYYVEDDTPVRFKVFSSFECHPKEELSDELSEDLFDESSFEAILPAEQATALAVAEARNEELIRPVEELASKASAGKNLKARGVEAVGERRNGKTTDRARDVDRLTVSFTLSAGGQRGELALYVRVLDPEGTLLVNSESKAFKAAGQPMAATTYRCVEYAGDDLPVTVYVNDIYEYIAGIYRVEVYSDAGLLGTTSFTLR